MSNPFSISLTGERVCEMERVSASLCFPQQYSSQGHVSLCCDLLLRSPPLSRLTRLEAYLVVHYPLLLYFNRNPRKIQPKNVSQVNEPNETPTKRTWLVVIHISHYIFFCSDTIPTEIQPNNFRQSNEPHETPTHRTKLVPVFFLIVSFCSNILPIIIQSNHSW